MSELTEAKFFDSATAIAIAYPSVSARYGYKKLIDMAKAWQSKTPEIVRADIESQAALADAIDEGLVSGEVKAERNGKGYRYQLGNLPSGGIDSAEVDRWRKIREIPEVERMAYYSSIPKPSRNGLMNWWKSSCIDAGASVEVIDAVATESYSEAVCTDDLSSLPQKHFGCVYADPPWKYGNQGTRASTDNHYQTMTIQDLCEMPVEDLVADDAHLHLWTTNAFIREAFELIEAWGFEYRSMFVWVKPQMGIGNYWRVSHEIMLLGIRGNAKRFNSRSLKSWACESRTRHSAKPDAIRTMVEDASSGPYLEMFGRKPCDGWTVFGNQITEESDLFNS